MDWKFLFGTFDGRIDRQNFWIGQVVLVAASVVAHLVAMAIVGTGDVGKLIGALITLALVYPYLVVDVKRLHDRGKTGWWILLLLVPIIGFFWFVIELGCLRGTVGANRYGADPLPPPAVAV